VIEGVRGAKQTSRDERMIRGDGRNAPIVERKGWACRGDAWCNTNGASDDGIGARRHEKKTACTGKMAARAEKMRRCTAS